MSEDTSKKAEGVEASDDGEFAMGGRLVDHAVDDGESGAEVHEADAPDAEKAAEAEAARLKLPEASDDEIPPWAKVPKKIKFPKGRRVVFVYFHGRLTDAPAAGDRQAILWALDTEDERMAFNRAQGDANRAPGELAKQMVRAIDGHPVDWSGVPSPASVDKFWRELGGKYRDLMIRVYAQLHVLSREDVADFFENCVAVRSTG